MSVIDAEPNRNLPRNESAGNAARAAASKVRRADTSVTEQSRSLKPAKQFSPKLAILLSLVTLLIGLAIGVQAMRLRAQARKALVSINGLVINQDELFPRLERSAGRQVMTQVLQEELQFQYAKSKGVVPTGAEVEARYKELTKQPDFEAKNMARGVFPEDVRQQLRLAIAKEGVLVKGITATDAEIKAFYRKNTDPANKQALFYTPESIQMAVIVTPTEAEARVALRDLSKGIPFSTVAQNRSKDPSQVSGGMLNPVFRGRTKSSEVPGMEAAIFGLKIGERLGPRRFAGTWWIIDAVDRTAAVTRPFDEVKEECRRQVLSAKGRAARGKQIDEEFNAFAKKANIKAFYDFYSPLVPKAD